MRSERALVVIATWDPDAAVWVAESADVPGFATEADSIEAPVGKLQDMIPELLELIAGELPGEIPFELLARRAAVARTRRC